ncbi:MAG TPA: sensor histidine kinase [Gemmatimonadaceae bacterium]|nr:sensor histidine kinase [Gemmatimonadaceae bacterium]
MDPTGARADRYARDGDLGAVATVLRARREELLGRWLAAAERLPFHAGRSTGAVADHIPRLFDAMVDLLSRSAAPGLDPGAALDDPALLAAAQSHARERIAQGLSTADVVQEFRLLRQEIGRALRLHLPEASSQSDAVAAELLVHDALDGAVFVAISTIAAHDAERRALLERADRARAEAEAAVRLRDGVLLAVSHDLRTPITAIRGNAQLLARHAHRAAALDPALADALTRTADAIVAATRRLSRWSDEITDVARLQIGQTLPLDRHRVDLVAMAHRVAAEYDAQSERPAIRVRAEVPELVGHWDGPRLERVLHNLVENALKYGADAGAIEITLDLAHPAPWAELRVRDTGIGIPADELAAVFEPFARGSNAQSVTGTGVGLASARHTVEQHGGTIDAASAEGAGTTVTVRLPLTAPGKAT